MASISVSPQARARITQAMRGFAFYATALLVALSWMALLPTLILVRLAGAAHCDAAQISGRKPWTPGVQVTVLPGGEDR